MARVLRDGWGEVESAGRRVRFLVAGAPSEAAPLVLLPSLGGDAAHWGTLGERLGVERQTIAIDPPGFGQAGPPPALPATPRVAKHLLAALELLQLGRFDLFGCSWGALLATRLALLAPGRVRRLVLASAAVRGRQFIPPVGCALRLLLDFIENPQPKPAIARDLEADSSDARGSGRPRLGGAGGSRARVLQFVAAALLHDVSRELGELRVPTLVLHGQRDVLLPPSTQAQLVRGLPQPVYRELPEAGHDLVNEAPEACGELITMFLRGQLRA